MNDFLIYTKSILLSLLLSVIEWKTTVSASVPRDVLRANNVLCTLASNLCRLDKEVPEHRSSVNYAGVHPWETPTVVLITNNGNGINYRHCLGETKHCTTPIYSVICIAKYIRYQMCCVCAEGREPRKTERYVS